MSAGVDPAFFLGFQAFDATLILLVIVTSLVAGAWLERVVRRGRPLL